MRNRSIVSMIGLMTFLIILSVGIAGCLQGTITASTPPTTYQQPTKVSGSSAWSPSTTNPTITSQPIQTFRIGDTASNGILKITINSINYQDKISGFAPDFKNYHYLIIDTTVTNLQKEKVVSFGYPWVNDVNGYTYEETSFSALEKSFNGDNILPGEIRRGNVLFEVPLNATGLKFKYNFGQGQIAVFNLQ